MEVKKTSIKTSANMFQKLRNETKWLHCRSKADLVWLNLKFILFSFTIGKLFTPISVCDASGRTATLFIPIKSTTMTGNEQLTCTTARSGLLEVWTNFVWLCIKLSPYCMLLQQDRLGIKTYVEIAQASFVTLCFKTAGCFWDILFS